MTPEAPLLPFTSPLTMLENFGITLPTTLALQVFLFLVFGIWFIFTLVVSYHWLRYSHSSLLAFPAIFVHLAISAAIMFYALTGVWSL
jgi:hypothetical protein